MLSIARRLIHPHFVVESSQEEVTRLLSELQQGNREVTDRLFSLVYETLHGVARRQRGRWRNDATLGTTAILHEAYLKLVNQPDVRWESRAHFLATAAKAMRHIIIDHARRRRAVKRGGNAQRVSIDEVGADAITSLISSDQRADEMLALEAALEHLAEVNDREARVVECRFFGGMTIEETAAALDVSTMTVKRDWAMARATLYRWIRPEPD